MGQWQGGLQIEVGQGMKAGKEIPGTHQLFLHLQDRLICIIETKEATKR